MTIGLETTGLKDYWAHELLGSQTTGLTICKNLLQPNSSYFSVSDFNRFNNDPIESEGSERKTQLAAATALAEEASSAALVNNRV